MVLLPHLIKWVIIIRPNAKSLLELCGFKYHLGVKKTVRQVKKEEVVVVVVVV